ncbi:MMPL family transporter [Luteimicrobium subarcticum]|uniref:RND superfamily putative drug exporter n=1 Tax=Luteimicrobium subarcticum TaxID=620910 RepID=A0A2M8W6V8_9MICO|nr:MMPL family transporter [Luteimicrobium subarcticum]PJI86658.1 RND superfamily putative drug exporter [Luteimicrobium subarcticum]
MAWQLFRLGRWSFVHHKLVVGAWVLLLALLGVGAATLSGQTDDNFQLKGIESTDAFALIKERSPQAAPDGATARIVFEAPEGQSLSDPANKQVVTDTLATVKTTDVQSIADPFTAGTISQNGRVGYATVSYDVQAVELQDADRTALTDAQASAEDAGLTVAIGGDALAATAAPPTGEVVGIVVALVVLTITFGSLLAAGMPLLTAAIGVGVGALAITTLTGFVTLSSTTSALGTMLGLAVGIDYALFIMSRYRSEVRKGRPLDEAAGRAVGTAGSAVVFAGLTVIIALAGLSVCRVPFLTQMGLGGSFTVAIAVLIALTLLPAILGFAGERVTSGGLRFLVGRPVHSGGPEVRTNGRRWVEGVAKLKWPALVGGVLIAAVASIPVASMQLALPDDASAPAGSNARVAYDLIGDSFGAGANGPLVVVVDTKGAQDPEAAVGAVTKDLQAMATQPGSDITAVIPPVTSDDPAAQKSFQDQLQAMQLATITVIPSSGPSDEATKNLVADIRASVEDLPAQTGARALVTGQTAVGVDISDKLSSVFPLYLLVVVGLAVFLLIAVFRSIWVPVKAALGFLLSIGVSLGATVAVFQWGWLNNLLGLDTTSPVMFLLPILLTGILFGLAMDYEVFLVTRMREAYVHGTPARQAVVDGFVHSARVVVAAACIMIGVFAGFALTDNVILKTIGFALAVGLLADAFLVRMTIVPAVMLIVGKRMWWMPKWLGPLVPNLDIEGEALTSRLDPPAVADGIEREPVTAR